MDYDDLVADGRCFLLFILYEGDYFTGKRAGMNSFLQKFYS